MTNSRVALKMTQKYLINETWSCRGRQLLLIARLSTQCFKALKRLCYFDTRDGAVGRKASATRRAGHSAANLGAAWSAPHRRAIVHQPGRGALRWWRPGRTVSGARNRVVITAVRSRRYRLQLLAQRVADPGFQRLLSAGIG